MKLFLVTARVIVSPYMGRSQETKDTKLVWAEDGAAAEAKYAKHWTDRSKEYGVSYTPCGIFADEALS